MRQSTHEMDAKCEHYLSICRSIHLGDLECHPSRSVALGCGNIRVPLIVGDRCAALSIELPFVLCAVWTESIELWQAGE